MTRTTPQTDDAPEPVGLTVEGPTLAQRQEALALRELSLREDELNTRELELAARRAAALASATPATIAVDAEDPAEVERREGMDARRHELVMDRRLEKNPAERRALARELFSLESENLADFAADLADHGTSLLAVLRKTAHNAFGIAI